MVVSGSPKVRVGEYCSLSVMSACYFILCYCDDEKDCYTLKVENNSRIRCVCLGVSVVASVHDV